MKINIVNEDLFKKYRGCYAHCISSDFNMSQGIAVEFEKKFNVKKELIREYGEDYYKFSYEPFCAYTVTNGRVLNLVTKKRYFEKPTLNDIKLSLISMRDIMENNGISHVSMPEIACGLDRHKWKDIDKILNEVFKDTDFEFTVYLKKDVKEPKPYKVRTGNQWDLKRG